MEKLHPSNTLTTLQKEREEKQLTNEKGTVIVGG